MGKGYAEGPAAEAAEEERQRRAHGETDRPRPRRRRAVLGSTAERPERHFLGWADEVDADALFAAGTAWGLSTATLEE